MIDFTHFTLDNGLRVIVHEDHSSAMATLNIMYNVGSRDENPTKTGFAHLFEHLMFGGSKHIPAYDKALQAVGGENNAYTTPDITNYYCTLPAVNLETAFWLESDRMLGLSFDPKVLAVQQKVVIEEFKECYLNQPYGDVWLKLLDLAYTKHPYKWPTIGKATSHIQAVNMQEVRDFFYQHYVPNNAVLVVGGGVTLEKVKQLSKKWFGPIPSGPSLTKKLPTEPFQKKPRHLTIEADVPLNAIYKAYHVPGRLEQGYHSVELIAEVLGGGKSARLHKNLVDKQQYFSTLSAYTTETIDPGLLIISGYLNEGVSWETAEKGILAEIDDLQSTITDRELEKAKNQTEAYQVFEGVDLLHRVQELAMATLLGDTNLVNTDLDIVRSITCKAIQKTAQQLLIPENCSTIYYQRRPA